MLKGFAGRKGVAIPVDGLRRKIGDDELKKIFRALTVKEIQQPGRPRMMAVAERHAYLFEGGYVYLPRIKARVLSKIVQIVDGTGDNLPLPPPRKLSEQAVEAAEMFYEYQEAAIEHLCGAEGVLTVNEVAYLKMDTGLGKTRVGCGVVAALGYPAIVVVPTEAIGGQWIEEFAAVYPGMKVAIYSNAQVKRGKVMGADTHDVLIVIINTFRDKEPSFLEGFGTVILDEAHELQSPCNGKALWLSQTKAVLGLSATPEGRPDGLDLYVMKHLGAVIDKNSIPGFDVSSVDFKGEVRVVEYAAPSEYCETITTAAGSMSAIQTIGGIIKDPYRLSLVASEVDRLYRMHETETPAELKRLGLGPGGPRDGIRRHGVFVFAEHREYLPRLRDEIIKKTGSDVIAPEIEPSDSPINVLRGGVAKSAVSDARRAGACIVLTTYGFSRRGVSLPDMTAIVLATPRRNGLVQILGRIFRRGSDESIVRQIVDIVDVGTGLRSQLSGRKKVYKEKGFPITKVSVKCDQPAEPEPEKEPDISAEDLLYMLENS